MAETKRITVEQVKAAYAKIGFTTDEIDGLGAIVEAVRPGSWAEPSRGSERTRLIAGYLGLEPDYAVAFDVGWKGPDVIIYDDPEAYRLGYLDGRAAALAMGLS